ncbi:MAG: HAMP domain-containing sensor histidine kinase [Polyangiaceae bacterium]|jgi:signal transduction histidine kinase
MTIAAPGPAHQQRDRVRFEALRRRIFDEMGHATARWRLTWFLLFNVLVLTLLVVRGESGPRALVQVLAVLVLGSLLAARIWWQSFVVKALSFVLGSASYFALLATTGGLASPLLVTSAVTITAAAIALRDPPWLRSLIILAFLGCFVALAILSRTSLGQWGAPLQPSAGWASPEYVIVTLLAVLFTMVGVYRMGCMMTRGYERAALELAERREELCSENEDRTRALEGMAARLAHEVKNPLAAIKGLSTHMARNATDPKTAERLAIVAAEADRLQSVVDGFLSFSRGLEDLTLAPTRVHEVARELAVLLEARAEDAGVMLQVSGDEALVVDADVRRLRQALLNIVLNAIQASSPGGSVTITVARDAEGARITVCDQGLGMTPEVIERIRKPYFTTKEGGSGLGLAVARGLIEQHGGRLEFKSAPGAGTTVSLRLPTKATPCLRLPNPRRPIQTDVADREAPESDPVRMLST